MIRFDSVSKTYHARGLTKNVLRDVNLTIEPGTSLGICGANGAGKSTLMRLIAGVEDPTDGRVVREMSTSWPIGYGSVFQSSLTGADNARFIARIYGKAVHPLLDFVEEFAQLGPYLHQPVRSYSAGMGARLAFGISLAVDFDCYLVDEITGAGDERFRRKCETALAERKERGTLIMISHEPDTLKQYCDEGAVLYAGTLARFPTIAEACEVHRGLQRRAA